MSSISGSKITPTNLPLETILERQSPITSTSVDDLTSRVSLLGRDSLNPLENRRVSHNIHDRTELDHSEDNFLESSSIDKDIFRSLPGEILFKIFDGFSSKDLNEIRTTNQYLKQSVDNYIEQTPKGLQRTWKASANFKINKIQDSPTTASKHILDLDLSCFSKLTPENLVDFLRFFPNITKIRLPSCIENNYLEALASMTNLEYLNLEWCSEITDAGLAHLGSLTRLQHLNLAGCDHIADEGLAYLAPLTQLQHLNLNGCYRITNEGLPHLKSLTQLQHLDLSRLWDVTDADEGLAHLAPLTQLQHLNLCDWVGMTDEGLAHLAPLTQLQHLNLEECTEITDEAKLRFIANHPACTITA